MRSLVHLLRHDVFGEDKRWQRYMANILTVVAKGMRLTDQAEPFGKQLDEIYRSPWQRHESTGEIVARILHKLGD